MSVQLYRDQRREAGTSPSIILCLVPLRQRLSLNQKQGLSLSRRQGFSTNLRQAFSLNLELKFFQPR